MRQNDMREGWDGMGSLITKGTPTTHSGTHRAKASQAIAKEYNIHCMLHAGVQSPGRIIPGRVADMMRKIIILGDSDKLPKIYMVMH